MNEMTANNPQPKTRGKRGVMVVLLTLVFVVVVAVVVWYMGTSKGNSNGSTNRTVDPGVVNTETSNRNTSRTTSNIDGGGLTPTVNANSTLNSNRGTNANISANANVAVTSTVSILNSGFSPKTLNVKPGTTVTFRNTDSKTHWPASDPHPAHTGLPGFDALHGLQTNESYSFTFQSIGNFRYHDHLNSSLTGTVIVE